MCPLVGKNWSQQLPFLIGRYSLRELLAQAITIQAIIKSCLHNDKDWGECNGIWSLIRLPLRKSNIKAPKKMLSCIILQVMLSLTAWGPTATHQCCSRFMELTQKSEDLLRIWRRLPGCSTPVCPISDNNVIQYIQKYIASFTVLDVSF